MANKFELPTDTGLAKKVIDSEAEKSKLKMKIGWLGQFFGVSKSVGLYIVGLISLLLLLAAIIYMFLPDEYRSQQLSPDKFWGIVLPVISTLIGYIFGFNSAKSDKTDEEE